MNANRNTALRMIEEISRGVIDDSIVTEDIAWWVPGRGIIRRDEFTEIVKTFRSFLDGDLTMTVHGVTADGDRVAVEAETLAKLKNGKIYNNTYHFLFLFRNGRICLAKEYNDSRHAAEVLGGAL